ncbi:MAG: nucleotidyl transferase AbiEii/AbiGii toxin family protein [Desulfovibrio sp.]|nr:nucleotidyl transferase AbiEii/AbiGii toxin family protein [Desulfovibrio sp.]
MPLPPGVLEKDFLTTEAIKIASTICDDEVKVVFCGGTCLAKAYGITGRMSEDADFRMVVREEGNTTSHDRRILSAVKHKIIDALRAGGFEFTEKNYRARDNNSSMRFRLPYNVSYPSVASLRPEIKMEFIKISPTDATGMRPVRPLAEEILNITSAGQVEVECVSMRETLSDKVVALLRRMGDDRASYSDDPRLMRHLYDIDRIVNIGRVAWEPSLQKLFAGKVQSDILRFKGHCAEFADDPVKKMNEAMGKLRSSPMYAANYAGILSDLVFERNPPDFEAAMSTFENIAGRLLDELGVEPEDDCSPSP